jgi:hypothetical protein
VLPQAPAMMKPDAIGANECFEQIQAERYRTDILILQRDKLKRELEQLR